MQQPVARNHIGPFEIESSVERRQFAAGLEVEARRLLNHGLRQNPTALQAIGYRQVVEFLNSKRTLPETIELVKTKTRQFAKRQLTWFRKHAAAAWLELPAEETAQETVEKQGEDLEKTNTRLKRSLADSEQKARALAETSKQLEISLAKEKAEKAELQKKFKQLATELK